jgi:hypothetical protein
MEWRSIDTSCSVRRRAAAGSVVKSARACAFASAITRFIARRSATSS